MEKRSIELMWHNYCAENDISEDSLRSEWAFCGGGPLADELADLVLKGLKTATSSVYEGYIQGEDHIPEEGEYSIVLDSQENPVCIIRNIKVSVVPFYDVSAEYAYKEGEFDRSLEFWRSVHKPLFEEDLISAGKRFEDGCHSLCEEFEVVYNPCELLLRLPEENDADDVSEFRNACLEEDGEIVGADMLDSLYGEEWINHANSLYACDDNKITHFICIRKEDSKFIGIIKVLQTRTGTECGNVVLTVRPDERGKGYGTWMLHNVLLYLRNLGMKEATLICEFGNRTACAVIESNGGERINSIGDRMHIHYRINLENKTML